MLSRLFTAATVGAALVSAATIAEINGNRYISPLNGTLVTGVKGLVTAVGKSGIYLRSTEPDKDSRTSEGLYVFNSNVTKIVKVGDVVTLDGKVEEYR